LFGESRHIEYFMVTWMVVTGLMFISMEGYPEYLHYELPVGELKLRHKHSTTLGCPPGICSHKRDFLGLFLFPSTDRGSHPRAILTT